MNAPAAVCILRGADHVFEFVNPFYQRLFPGRELVGKPIRAALAELHGQGFYELLDQVFTTGEPYVGNEMRALLDRAGTGELEECFFDFIYDPMFESTRVAGITVFAFDVTEHVLARRRAEQHAQAAEERVRRSDEMFRLLVEHVKDYAIFMLDVDGRVVTWNAGAERIYGWKAEDVIGRSISIFHPEEVRERAAATDELQIARTRGTFDREELRVRGDSTLFWAHIVITPVFDKAHELRGYAKVTRDVTERRHAEEAQRTLAEERSARLQAEAASRAKDEFIALVSHELRTPLTSILGWARMLRMGRLDKETTLDALDALERSAETQVHLVEDLLDSARVQSGKLRLDKRPLDLKPLIEAAIADVAPIAEAKQIRLTKDISCECHMEGDPTRLQQVVWNLLTNAVKFTPEHGTVSVRLYASGSTAVIEVRDTGRGIEANVLPRLFNRFEQGDAGSKDRRAGLGLGLALSRHLVEQHGGRIEARSDGPGKGATFTARLPLAAQAAQPFVERDAGRMSGLPRLDGVRLLLVEDEVDNREMLATVARECGAEVVTTSTAADALDVLQRWRPHVMVCDVALPDVNGCELLQRARATLAEPAVPALALTVLGSAPEEAKIVAAGFDVFRQKPIEPADFAHEIARLAGGDGAPVKERPDVTRPADAPARASDEKRCP
jgi:PAS domain S-box-containing protein